MTTLTVIGAGEFDPSSDACFGRHSRTSEKCHNCIAPVLVGRDVRLFNEVCEAFTQRGDLALPEVAEMTEAEVMDRISAGRTPAQIVQEMMPDGNLAMFDKAWEILRRRAYALRRKGARVPEMRKIQVRKELRNGHDKEEG